MKSLQALLLQYALKTSSEGCVLTLQETGDEVSLIRFVCNEPAKALGIDQLDDEDCRLILRIADQLFHCPTRSSREIGDEFALDREHLVRLYKVIRNTPTIQKALTFESPMRRRISFLRKELLPGNIPTLYSMFSGAVCLPNHVEFHPALMCNLRCRACPNCQADSKGDWYFLGYSKLGEPLNGDRLQLIADLFLEMGVRNFSFGGGGEPSLSDLTLGGIARLRSGSGKAEISLYTNGIFPSSWGTTEFHTLVTSLNKIRFSIDAADAEEWSRYKGRPEEFFEILWTNIAGVVQAKRKTKSATRIGASCLVSDLTCNEVGMFLERARDTGLDFCDIKAVETCFGEKAEFRVQNQRIRDSIAELTRSIQEGRYAPMDVVVDDSLLRSEEDRISSCDIAPSRCWVAIRGRMLTVGPYGELYPCSDAANPGAKERHNNKMVGQLTAFSNLDALREEFSTIWNDSLTRRETLSRENCSYCVPSHNNYNTAVDKLYQDWKFGIRPEDQPFAGEKDHYLASRGA